MGRLKLLVPNSTVQLPFSDDTAPVRGFGANKTIIGKAGAEIWFEAELEISSEYEYTRLEAEFEYDADDPIDRIHRSRQAFGLALKIKFQTEFASCIRLWTDKRSLSVNEWNFWKILRIEFVIEKNHQVKSPIAKGVNPYFNIRHDKQQVSNLIFTLSGKKHGFTIFETIESSMIGFEASNKAPKQGNEQN